ncbi:hypothetical protein [Thiorhodococcus drewsii]|nr:hypothetical protein [Thiorhodococcus drewsii]
MQRWINPEKDRYDLIDLVQDLFGDWALVLCALGSRRGRLRVVGPPSEAEVQAQVEDIARHCGRAAGLLATRGLVR